MNDKDKSANSKSSKRRFFVHIFGREIGATPIMLCLVVVSSVIGLIRYCDDQAKKKGNRAQFESYIYAGDVYYKKWDFKNAYNYYEKAFKIYSEEPEIIFKRTFARVKYHNLYHHYTPVRELSDKERELYNDLLGECLFLKSYKHKNHKAYFLLGEVYQILGQPHEALKHLNRAIEIKPSSNTYTSRAFYNIKEGKLEQAFEDIKRSLEFDSENANTYLTRGIAYVRSKKYKMAIKDYEKALDIDPYLHFAYHNIGSVHMEEKAFSQAIGAISKAIRMCSYIDYYYRNRGRCHLSRGEYQLALADFNMAIKCYPDNPWNICDRGRAYIRMKEFDQAMRDMQTAIALGKNGPKDLAIYYNNIGWIYYHKHSEISDEEEKHKGFNKALKYYNRAKRLDRKFCKPYLNKATIYEETNRLSYAVREYKQLIENQPDNLDEFDARIGSYARKAQLAGSLIEHFESESCPDCTQLLAHLSEIEESIDKFKRLIAIQYSVNVDKASSFLKALLTETKLSRDEIGNTLAILGKVEKRIAECERGKGVE